MIKPSLAIALLLLALSGCGQNTSTPSAPPAAAPAAAPPTVEAAASPAAPPAASQAPGFSRMDVRRDRDIRVADLPVPVATTARAELSIITSAERLEMRDGSTLYEVEGRTARGRERELIVAPDGTIVRSRDD